MDTPRPPSALQFLVLNTLQDLAGSPEALGTMLRTIQESMADDLAQLQKSSLAQDAKAVGLKLHSIKGYMPLLCQPALAERLFNLEALFSEPAQLAPSQWPTQAINALLADLGTLLQELQVAVKRG